MRIFADTANFFRTSLVVFSLLLAGPLLASCAWFDDEEDFEEQAEAETISEGTGANEHGIFGEGGLFGGSADEQAPGNGSGVGVNSYLWRASLDTISFMPISHPDPFGGVIVTDWYAPANSPNERFKVNIFILGRALRADGVRATIFRQVLDRSGVWRDAPVPKGDNTKLEDAILNRARRLRHETLPQ
jgi:hypothetical protein